MGEYKTLGVYIKEKNAFGNSVVEAETAIPAFIGFTEKAVNGDKSLLNQPWKITSMTEFITYFGGAPQNKFTLTIDKEKNLIVEEPKVIFTLYYQMLMFFANGGSTCYIVSVGDYKGEKSITDEQVNVALTALEKEQEVTMIVVPEAVYSPNHGNILTNVLKHCGSKMKNRIAILDVQLKDTDGKIIEKPVDNFRDTVGSNYMSFGAAYYPWLNTSVLSENDINETIVDVNEEVFNQPSFFGSNSDMQDFFKKAFLESKEGQKKVIVEELDEEGKPTTKEVRSK